MSTKINPKDCGHNAGVQIDNWARNPGTENPEPFLIARCESCDQIISVMRGENWLGRFERLMEDLDDISTNLTIIHGEICLQGAEYRSPGKSIKERLEEVAANLKKMG